MNADFDRELLYARSEGTEAVRNLAEKHLPLVHAMIRRFPNGGFSREDLFQQGVLGLMKAIYRYDPVRGIAFSTYACAMIIGEMRMLRRLDAPIHIPRTEREMRQRVRRAEEALIAHLGREPSVSELADSLHMDAAELMLHMEDVTVSSTDALSPGGAFIADILPDPDDWQKRVELRDILSRLPEKDRQLVLLRYRVGLTQAQTGKRIGMTQMQISRRERIIRTLLRRALLD